MIVMQNKYVTDLLFITLYIYTKINTMYVIHFDNLA